MLVYLLALGSPTHPVDAERLERVDEHLPSALGHASWARSTCSFAPLFGHQYSHVWIDFRGIQDAYMRAARHRLLREHAPRHLRAARLRDRQSEGLARLRRERLGPHRLRRPGRRDDRPIDGEPRAFLRLLRRAAPAAGDDPRRRHDRADRRRRRRSPFAPEIAIPAVARDARALRRSTSIRQVRLPRRVQPELHRRPTCKLQRRPRRSRRSAGSTTTTSASTRARSSR